MRPLLVLLTLVLSLGIGNPGLSAAETRIALVIGNSAYRNADELPNPRNDARAIGEVLEEVGFEVSLGLDLDQPGMQDALREFGYRAESADIAVVFYAGHGVQVSGENYLLPVDANLRRERDLIYEALPLTLIMGEVAQARRLGLVILDACRDNPLAERLRRALGPIRSRLVGTGLARLENVPSDTMVAFSTRPGELAVDGQGEHSPYTEALLRHLDEPGVELDLLFRKVRDTVLELTAQRQEPRTYDALSAQPFYFREPRPNQRPELAELEPLEVLDDVGSAPLGIQQPTDPDGDLVTAQVTGLPRDGTVAVAGRAVVIGDVLSPQQLADATFAPSGTFTGDAGSFVFLVRDNRGGMTIGRLPIAVTPSNKPPVVATQQVLRLPAIPLNLDPPVDPEGDPLTITVLELPERGQIRSGERRLEVGDELTPEGLAGLVLQPAADGARGSFRFEVSDPQGASATSALRIDVPGLGTPAAPETAQTPPAEVAPPEVVAESPAAPETPPAPAEQAALAPEPEPEPVPAITEPIETARAEQAAAVEYRTLRDSNIRSGPSTETARVVTVPEDTMLRVLGQVEGRDWYQVETADGHQGYIYGTLIEPKPPQPGTAAAAVGAPEATTDAPAEPEQQQTAQLGPGRTLAGALRDCDRCPALVPIPSGSFVMGSDAGHRSERPTRRVTVQPFALGKYEVTIGEYQACVDAGACAPQPRTAGLSLELPMHDISWSDAQDYVAWLREETGEAYRLPSEAEWEYAARAGSATRYWWGDEVGAGNANCSNCGGPYDRNLPAAVGTFEANPLGVHDMNGGVMEWVGDCWFNDYRGAPADGGVRGASGCPQRVLRGGSWRNDQTYATSTSRLGYDFDVRYPANGLRVARDLD